ncbi:ROK family transcriptional regulator [Aliihoeflea sp. PC F10.4]
MTMGVRHDDLRKRNRALVIAAVRRDGQPSRTELATRTGLSHSTISAIASDLIAEGVLRQAKGSGGELVRRGRPQVSLELEPRAGTVLAVVLLLNTLSASVIDYAGRTVCERHERLSTLTASREELIEAVSTIIKGVLGDAARDPSEIMRMTMAIQGIIDSGGRTLLWTPITPHSGIAFADFIETRFGFPVTVQNDCNMIALALRAREPERYRDNFVTILLSNGIGMGLVLRGELFTGAYSSGGEFGHMVYKPHGALCRCGRHGCVEAYAGNYAILRASKGQEDECEPDADVDRETMLQLAGEARQKDGPAREAFMRAGEALGYGLGSLFALIDPAPVAVVGPGTHAFDIMEPAIREAIAQTAGGQHDAVISFDLEADEMPLIREGCARKALEAVDNELFAPGYVNAMQETAG